MDLNKIIGVYTKIRDKRSEIKKAYETQDNALKANLEQIEAVLLRQLIATQSDSTRTEAGTFYRQKDIMPSCSDWAALYAWIKENDAFDALERRVKKGFITDYMEEHGKDDDGNTILPPGVNIHTKYVIRVRKN